ncbi:MAG: DUF4388 domain-containing protein [Thermoanaerobaculia bacterium]
MSDTTAPRFEYRSDLAGTPLPEVLLTIHKYRVPGTIDCARAAERKQIFLDQGLIIFAASNQTSDSLGDRLLAQGVITQEEYDESVARLRAGGGKRHGTLLVEMGVLQPKDLFVSVREQVQAIVWSLFDWDAGAVTFAPGREKHAEFIKLSIPILDAVVQGVRRTGDPKRLLARIGSKTTILECVAERDLAEIPLDPAELALLERVDGRATLFDLTSTEVLPPPQAARALYLFHVLGLTQPRRSKRMKVQVRGGE